MEHLDIFAVVVEQQSLNRASRILNISQPALSRKMMKMEEELGVSLFTRRGKRLELTPAGRICYDYAVGLRRLEADFLQSLIKFRTGDAPSAITIGASLTTLQSALPELISLYTSRYPQTDIQAITGKTHEIVSLVKEKRADIGLIASVVDAPGLHCVPLFDDHLALLLPAGHPLSERPSLTVEDLHGLPMILFSKGTWYRVLTDEMFQHQHIRPNVKMEIDSFEAIVRLVPTLGAATMLPMSYLRRNPLIGPDLSVRMIPELAATKRTTSLIFLDEVARNATLHAFIWKAKEHFMDPALIDEI